jgi:hypothetical protein
MGNIMEIRDSSDKVVDNDHVTFYNQDGVEVGIINRPAEEFSACMLNHLRVKVV